MNAGIRATTRGLKFAMGWGLATATLGREPESVEEYAEVMQESRATAFRDQQAFRQAYPEEENPTRMNKVTGAQARYDEIFLDLKDLRKASVKAQPMIFTVGASAFAR
jgi:hypothetical protein